ncbi:MAG: DegV family EDD domain-containing protein [Anaerolineaceae bacterium]|nr:DegV family EDD domain-containing protein [Anaerolineaceae bacterium]
MDSICILTDNSAQFPKPTFQGHNLVTIIPLSIHLEGQIFDNGSDLRANQLPHTADEKLNPRLIPPTPEKFRGMLSNLSLQYDSIIAIFLSSHLNPCYQNAKDAAHSLRGGMKIHLIDSKTTSVGLGILVQAAAEAASMGISAPEIERMLRSMISHTYSVLCTPGLSYLYFNGYIDRTQAIISEMLGLLPVFAIENGKLTAIEKVRSNRHALVFFQEFLDEFERLQYIAFIQSAKPNYRDARLIHENSKEGFPKTPFSKHLINLPVAIMFGPESIGLIVLENPGGKSKNISF